MSVLLNPGQSLIVEHSVGGLREEVDMEVILGDIILQNCNFYYKKSSYKYNESIKNQLK